MKAAPPPGSGATELAECGWRARARHRPSQVRATSDWRRWSHCETLARALSEFCCGLRVSDIWELSTMPQPELKSNEDKIWASANKNTTWCAILNNRYNIQSNHTCDPLGSKSRETVVKTFFFQNEFAVDIFPQKQNDWFNRNLHFLQLQWRRRRAWTSTSWATRPASPPSSTSRETLISLHKVSHKPELQVSTKYRESLHNIRRRPASIAYMLGVFMGLHCHL